MFLQRYDWSSCITQEAQYAMKSHEKFHKTWQRNYYVIHIYKNVYVDRAATTSHHTRKMREDANR